MLGRLMLAVVLFAALAVAAPETGSVTDSRDGKNYRTVKIGDQVWMAENLNFNAGKSSCALEDCNTYGRLYTWAPDLCPDGFQLPKKEDFEILLAYAKKVRASKNAKIDSSAFVLKSKKFKILLAPYFGTDCSELDTCDPDKLSVNEPVEYDGRGADDLGFDALPATFEHGENGSMFWTSTEIFESIFAGKYAYVMELPLESVSGTLPKRIKSAVASVRCIKK